MSRKIHAKPPDSTLRLVRDDPPRAHDEDARWRRLGEHIRQAQFRQIELARARIHRPGAYCPHCHERIA